MEKTKFATVKTNQEKKVPMMYLEIPLWSSYYYHSYIFHCCVKISLSFLFHSCSWEIHSVLIQRNQVKNHINLNKKIKTYVNNIPLPKAMAVVDMSIPLILCSVISARYIDVDKIKPPTARPTLRTTQK